MLHSAWLVLGNIYPRPRHDTPALPHQPPSTAAAVIVIRHEHVLSRVLTCNTAYLTCTNPISKSHHVISHRQTQSRHQHWRIICRFPYSLARGTIAIIKAKLPSQKVPVPDAVPCHAPICAGHQWLLSNPPQPRRAHSGTSIHHSSECSRMGHGHRSSRW